MINDFVRANFLIKYAAIVAIIGMIAISFFSCASVTKPYVGRTIKSNSPYVCNCQNLPVDCLIGQQNEYFILDYNISKGNTPNEYVCKGYLAGTGKGGFTNIETGFRVMLLLIKDGVVINSTSLSPMGDDLDRKLPFEKTFQSPPFDAIAITYEGSVSG